MEKEVNIFGLNDIETGVDFIKTTADFDTITETFDDYVYGDKSKLDEDDRNIIGCLKERGYEASYIDISIIDY